MHFVSNYKVGAKQIEIVVDRSWDFEFTSH